MWFNLFFAKICLKKIKLVWNSAITEVNEFRTIYSTVLRFTF